MKTVREYIQPHGARVALRIEQHKDSRLFNAYRYVNEGEPSAWLGWPKKTIDWAIREWIAFEERRGSQKTTDKWECEHCPWCEQKLP